MLRVVKLFGVNKGLDTEGVACLTLGNDRNGPVKYWEFENLYIP